MKGNIPGLQFTQLYIMTRKQVANEEVHVQVRRQAGSMEV